MGWIVLFINPDSDYICCTVSAPLHSQLTELLFKHVQINK